MGNDPRTAGTTASARPRPGGGRRTWRTIRVDEARRERAGVISVGGRSRCQTTAGQTGTSARSARRSAAPAKNGLTTSCPARRYQPISSPRGIPDRRREQEADTERPRLSKISDVPTACRRSTSRRELDHRPQHASAVPGRYAGGCWAAAAEEVPKHKEQPADAGGGEAMARPRGGPRGPRAVELDHGDAALANHRGHAWCTPTARQPHPHPHREQDHSRGSVSSTATAGAPCRAAP